MSQDGVSIVRKKYLLVSIPNRVGESVTVKLLKESVSRHELITDLNALRAAGKHKKRFLTILEVF